MEHFTAIGKNIIPTDYTQVGHYIYFRIPDGEIEEDAMLEPDGLSKEQHDELEYQYSGLDLGPQSSGCKCNICGAKVKKGVFIQNKAALTVHLIGLDCASSVAGMAVSEFSLENEGLAKYQKRRKAEKIKAIYDANPGLEQALEGRGSFVRDIKEKLERFHNLSDKQIAAVMKTYNEAQNRKAQLESGDIKAVPNGRCKATTLTITSHKVETFKRPGRWSYTEYKATVCFEHQDGWRACYSGEVSEFANATAYEKYLYEGNKATAGTLVTMDFTVTPGSDPSFGKLTRPANIVIG